MNTTQTSNSTPVDLSKILGVPPEATKKSTNEDAQDKFLKLLVTQMQNQDPLNPMDNAQVTTQIAQLNTVSGIDRLNTTLSNMAASFTASQSIQAASLIGHGVLIPGSEVSLRNGSAIFGADLAQGVDSLKVSIKDSAGNVLHTVDFGPQKQGTVALGWDGRTDAGTIAANGDYQFVLTALSAGKEIKAAPLGFSEVGGVSTTASGVVLNLGGSRTAVLGDVKQVL